MRSGTPVAADRRPAAHPIFLGQQFLAAAQADRQRTIGLPRKVGLEA